MSRLLYDLYAHQVWADAEHWRAMESHPRALDDDAIRKRLHHIHLTQRAFLSIVRKENLEIRRLEDFPDMAALKDYAKSNHKEAGIFVKGISERQLEETLVIPWFKDPPISLTVEQALTQAAMHSHYHRAQNATRLRELGGEPPLTDLIVWYWKGKPEVEWN